MSTETGSSTTGGSGSGGSAPTLPPELTAPPASGSTPNLTREQWTQAAEAYDAIPKVDPCVALEYQDAFYAIDMPDIPPSEALGMAYVKAMIAQMRLYYRSLEPIDPGAAKGVLRRLDAAEKKLDGPYPDNVTAFLTALVPPENEGASLDALDQSLQDRCET